MASIAWFLARGLPITDASGTILRWFGTSTDIEDQKQEEVRQRFLAELSEQTRLLGDPQDVLQTAIRLLGTTWTPRAPPTAKWTCANDRVTCVITTAGVRPTAPALSPCLCSARRWSLT